MYNSDVKRMTLGISIVRPPAVGPRSLQCLTAADVEA